MGVARLEGRVVFVPYTIQGERWRVRLEKVNKNVAWGRGVELLLPSPMRLQPDCPLYGKCGGCQFRHMRYEEELRAKGQRIADALERVGHVKLDLPPVLGAERPDRYRNKVQFPVSQGKQGLAVGYYRPRSHDVLDAPDCPLQPEAVTRLRAAFKGWMEAHRVPPYSEGTGRGLIRHLYVRASSRGESLVCVVANGDSLPNGSALADALRQAEPGLAGVVLNTNTRDTNVILGDRYDTLWGRDWLEEDLCQLTFRLSVPSFFQINRDQTERLYRTALDFAQLTGSETVLDLYCGIGTISLALAKQSSEPRSFPRPLRTPGRTPGATGSQTQSSSAATRGRWPGGWRRRGSAPRWSAWTRPGRGWPRRSPPSWRAWPPTGWSMSPATPPPWPGTQTVSALWGTGRSRPRGWICSPAPPMWRLLCCYKEETRRNPAFPARCPA